MTSLAAVILAGGRSSRMGHDKALISVGTETLIQRTYRVALACADTVYVVTPWPDRYHAALPNSVAFIVEPCLPRQSGTFQGPLPALIKTLDVLQARSEGDPDWVLTLACDMPNLSVAVLSTWRDQLAHLSPHHLAYLPKRQQRWEPLCGFYRVAALESLKQYAATGGRSLQDWLNQQAIAPIPHVDAAMLTNINTPDDLAEWQKTKDS
ncbi:MAG: molybdenum cofactor guanylyltransferase [Tildeniella torsiva UHER 1998/13D]|jgi:molybdopterin-guanine dinucleotide biosynthesis protein A|nr:molybdenum cofactor guanylyltransferase [Tildeniella torsiva UHER 1998/13D]